VDSDPAGTGPFSGADLALLRHDRLRRTAPAVQHEINNALMVLASNLELLGRTAVEGPPRRQLDRAQEAMRRLESTVRGFLDAARREVEDPAAVSPAMAVAQALPLLRVALGARFGFDLAEPERAKEIWPARLDRGRLDLGLLCLVRDAAGRMAPGARIVARAENREAGQEVALRLELPDGAAPSAEAGQLLAEAATGTGGRLEREDGAVTLVWPKA
jgi:signal transduction histidine kinase